MSFSNYTLIDLARVSAGFGLFALFALLPGYVIGWLSNILSFRERPFREKVLLALAGSAAVSPLLVYLAGRMGGFAVIWAIFAMLAVAGMALIVLDLSREKRPFSGTRLPMLAALGWIVVALIAMVDFGWKDRLYVSYTGFDLSVRTEFTDAIARTGVTPANPFFFPGHPVPLRYHYFWFLPCALVENISGGWVGPSDAIIAASIWGGFALFALLTLYVWRFRQVDGPPSSRRSWVAMALVWVMGLDIIPVLLYIPLGYICFTPDSWNNEVAGWFHSLLSAPHHVAAAVACLTAFLALWTSEGQSRGTQIGSMIVAGMGFACSAGLSIYVSLVFAASMFVLAVITIWKRWWPDTIRIACASALAVVFALPYLVVLMASHGRGGSDHVISPTIREFYPVQWLLHDGLNVGWPAIAAVNALLLPLNYAFELGLFLLVAVLQFMRYSRRRTPLGRKDWAEIVLISVPVLICTFFRSSLVNGNDLGWRGFLVAQFVLILWAIDYVRLAFRKSFKLRRIRRWISVSVWIGLAGTGYAFVVSRAYVPMIDAGLVRATPRFLGSDHSIGRRTFALRETYNWVNQHFPRSAVVLINPNTDHDVQYGLYAKRQGVATDFTCGTTFGGSFDTCRQMLSLIRPVFNDPTAADRIDLDALCRDYSAGLIVVKDNDPSWRSSQSWVWRRTPVYSSEFSRVFACNAPAARAGLK
ncbi:MAG TPA: hypothetical protein VKU01_22540 [Bryobacteraceae bacterium]|nr:hypothetical protein [Bryobacteraceae bacterium]